MLSRDSNNSIRSSEEINNTITYNTDNISIISQFGDEMSVYRCRRTWTEILSNHFLLEKDRDFKMSISASESPFILTCEFNSACGRYAFWRLINQQAPEAENKLINSGYPGSELFDTEEPTGEKVVSPWIMSGGVSEPIRRRKSLSKKLLELLWNRKG